MSVYTISDLHLPLGIDKPMDVFGTVWENYTEKLRENWQTAVSEDDTVVIGGDFCWATYIEQAYKDFEFLSVLPGKKVILKGNHDYWWTTKKKMDEFLQANKFNNIDFLQNNSYIVKAGGRDIGICGTRGWSMPNAKDYDAAIFSREVQRLELSIQSAADKADEIIVFMHYPPVSSDYLTTGFTEVMNRYGIKKCIYGHLHAKAHSFALQGDVNGIEYTLVSADYMNFMPLKII